MNMIADQPEPIPNLIARVRADGMKIFTPVAREQLIRQARTGEHSVGALARANGVPTFLLQRWLAGGTKKISVKSKPKKKSPPTQLIPVRLKPSPQAASALLACEVVLARGSIKVQVDKSGLADLVLALSV
jgi:transposase-like protein